MPLLEVGRVCIKKNGRDAGSRAVVTKIIDTRFVSIISGKRAKERRCNVSHLEFLNEKVDTKDRSQINKMLGISETPKVHKKDAK